MFEGDGGSDQSGKPAGGVFLLKGGTATKLAGSPAFVAGLAWHKGTLYVSGANLGAERRDRGQHPGLERLERHQFAKQKMIYTRAQEVPGLQRPGLRARRPAVRRRRRLLNQSNDHGPAKHAVRVRHPVVQGQRQGPEGVRHRHAPAVADGVQRQVEVAVRLRPRPGQAGQHEPAGLHPQGPQGRQLRLPACNWIKAKACKGFAKPFKFFGPHTDAMGLAIIGKTLYISEFGGNARRARWCRCRVGGGKIKPPSPASSLRSSASPRHGALALHRRADRPGVQGQPVTQ